MGIAKRFDCVEMKNGIQARHRKEYEGLTNEQIRQRIHEKLAASDDVVARKWRQIGKPKRPTARTV